MAKTAAAGKRPKKAKPVTASQGVETDTHGARAWSSIEFRFKMQDYEGVTVAAGMSQPVENSRVSIRKLHRSQLAELETLMGKKVAHLREIWEEL